MNKKGDITRGILAKAEKMSQNLKAEKLELVADIQTYVNESWGEYVAEKQKFDAQKSTANLDKIDEVKDLEAQLAVMKGKIERVNEEMGSLSKSFAKKQKIKLTLPDINTSVNEEIAFVENQLKRLNGEPSEISSDGELAEELALVKKQFQQYEAQRATFRKHVVDYKAEHGESSLGDASGGDFAERKGIQDLGIMAKDMIAELNSRAEAIKAFGKVLDDADGELLDNIVVENRTFTKEFFETMRGGKKPKVYAPEKEQVKDEASTVQFIASQNISTKTILTESSKLGNGLFDSIMKKNAEYNKILEAGLEGVHIENVRNLLFDIRLECGTWLDKHQNDKPDSKQAKQAKQIRDLQPLISKHIAIIGGLAINKDNYLEITKNFEANLASVDEFNEMINGTAPKGMTGEEYTIRKDKLKEKIIKAIKDRKADCDDWRSKHNDGSFGYKKKDNTLNDLLRTLTMRAYKFLGEETPDNDYVQKKTYSKADDKKLTEIDKMIANSRGKQKSTNYKDRFKKLGDLNNAIQAWKHNTKYYEGDDIDAARAQIKDAEEFLSTEYDVVNAQMSMKGLEAGFSERLTQYKKWVHEYNEGGDKNQEERHKKFPKIIEGSNAIIEFVDTWKEQYAKLKDSKVPIPEETAKRLLELEKEYDKTKKTIEDSNFAVLTGMADLSLESKSNDLKAEASAKEDEIARKKHDRAMIELKINTLKSEMKVLELDIENEDDVDQEDLLRDKLDSKEPELEKLIKELEALGGVIDGLQEIASNKKLQAQQFEERLEKQKRGGASVLYLSIVKEFEEGKTNQSFEYDETIDLATETNRRNFISKIMGMIVEWNKLVVDPSLEYLEPYVRTLHTIEAELKLHLKQFNEKKSYVDKTYSAIEKSYGVIKKALKNGDASLSALQELEYCRKLIGYWFKEHPIELERDVEKRKDLAQKRIFIVAEIESTRFLSFKEEQEADELKRKFDKLLLGDKKSLDERMKQFASEDIYNASTPDIGKELSDSEKRLSSLFRKMFKAIGDDVDPLMSGNKFKEAKVKLSELYNEYVEKYKELQGRLHKALVEKEKRIFVSVSEHNFDYETSGQFTPEELALMQKTLENISARANAILHAGGTSEEAEKMFEHIPVALWPDKFVSELQAFKSVEKALEEEARQGAQDAIDEEHEALGIKNLLKDVGKMGAEGTKALADKFAEVNSLLWYDDDTDDDGEDETRSVFTKEEQGKAYGSFVEGVEWAALGLDLGLSTVDFVGKTKEQIAQLKMERAKAFLFEGKVKFNEDGTGGFEQDPAKNTVAQKKRVLILMGLKFAAETTQKISGAISGASDAHDGSKELTGITKDIAAVFGAMATAIDMVSSDDLPRTTQEAWDKNFTRVTTIAKGLLSLGVTVAETVKLFQTIPSEVIPGLGIATGVIDLAVNVHAIAKDIIKLDGTSKLLDEAQIHDRAYVGPLKQEMTALKRKVAKRAVDMAADGVAIAGGIATVSGVAAPVGAAISLVAGVMKLGNEIVFASIDEAQMKLARDLLKKARAGDREAQMQIMQESPIYAKMFIAIGATEEPPNPIALEFVRQRGLTERDINDGVTDKWVVRKFVRTHLLEATEEADNHEGKLGPIKGLISKIDKWHTRCQRKHGFWEGTVDQSFKLLTELYSTKQLEKMVLDFTKHVDDLKKEDSKVVKKFLGVQVAFSKEFEVVEDALSEVSEELTSTIEIDKKSKSKDFSPEILKLGREKEGLENQKEALENILEIIGAVKKLAA